MHCTIHYTKKYLMQVYSDLSTTRNSYFIFLKSLQINNGNNLSCIIMIIRLLIRIFQYRNAIEKVAVVVLRIRVQARGYFITF